MKEKDEVIAALRQLGQSILQEIERGENPSLEVPIRSLSNVKYNPETRMLELGEEKAKRYFFNIAHVRKFVQTMGVAALSKELREANKHLSLREAFYTMKRTLPGSDINLVDDQTESNLAIEDLELIT
ncbi:MAG: hypothetical protein QW356_06930, partial [Candidatus Hadarchaeales archaeon]